MKFPLRHIILEVTQQCNLSCLYCYNYWRRAGEPVAHTTFQETTRTLNRLLKTVDFEHLTLTGGEPFLADGLKELVLKSRMKGKGVTIVTNGTTATNEDYVLLSDMGVSLFELPLHANSPDVHDRMTGAVGSFKKVIASIEALSKLPTETCSALVLTKLNCDRVYETLKFAEGLGVERVMLARFNIGGRGIENISTLLPTKKELVAAFDAANEFAEESKMLISANVCVPQCVIDPTDFPNIPISMCGADATKRPITIGADGNVRMCNHSPNVIGNIHIDDRASLFESDYLTEWETTCPDLCRDCKHWNKCRGGCRAASEQMGRGLACADPAIEMMRGA